jgi:RNA recognition motif-containing protein
MGKNRNRRFAKRKRELEKKERAEQKRAKRLARGSSSGDASGPPLDDVLTAQARDKPTDEEARLAVERAMNPGNKGARSSRRQSFGRRLFVGNLSAATQEDELKALFVEAGFDVSDATIPRDRTTGQPRGFAFVELSSPAEAERAIERLNGATFHSRELRVNAAEPV